MATGCLCNAKLFRPKATKADREPDLAPTEDIWVASLVTTVQGRCEIIFTVKKRSHSEVCVSLSPFCWRGLKYYKHLAACCILSTLMHVFFSPCAKLLPWWCSWGSNPSNLSVFCCLCMNYLLFMRFTYWYVNSVLYSAKLGQGTLWEAGGLAWPRFPTLPPFVSPSPPFHPSSQPNTRFPSHL